MDLPVGSLTLNNREFSANLLIMIIAGGPIQLPFYAYYYNYSSFVAIIYVHLRATCAR